MKPFTRLIPWIRHCTGLDADQHVEKEAIPVLRKHDAEVALENQFPKQEEIAERLTVEKLPLGAHKSKEVQVNYAMPDFVQESQNENRVDAEDQWVDIPETKRRSISWKLAPAIYAVAATAHVVITLISVAEPDIEHRQKIEAHIQKSTLEKQEDIVTVDQLQTAVKGYLNASSVDEKIKWVRHPERVRPLMDLHYKEHALEDRKFQSIKKLRSVTVWSKSYILLSAELESGGTQFLAIEHGADNAFKIDWETEVCYQPMSWQEFSNTQKPISVDMRVLARPDTHYTRHFSEGDEYICFRMVTRDNKSPVYGYVQKNSAAWHDLRLFFTGKRQTQVDGEPVILRLRVPDKGMAKNGVIIERFLSDRWMYIESPDSNNQPKSMAAVMNN